MIRRPPRSTLFPTRRSSDLSRQTYPHESHRLPVVVRRSSPRYGLAAKVTVHSAGPARLVGGTAPDGDRAALRAMPARDRKSTRLNSSHSQISYAVFCLKKKK